MGVSHFFPFSGEDFPLLRTVHHPMVLATERSGNDCLTGKDVRNKAVGVSRSRSATC